jgi:[NiFe] hydrogenase assembly HybE family chaperone
MTPELLPDPSARLEAAFAAVSERMRGLPVVNPALRVQAVAFAPWQAHWLGVLVTPWSINLMLLPRDPAQWRPAVPGAKTRLAFPAGTYDFIDATEPAVGEYRLCSLFSPAFEFEDHESAVLVAQLARAGLLDAANADDGLPPGTPLADLQARAEAPLSKRDFLRGRFLGRSDVPGG